MTQVGIYTGQLVDFNERPLPFTTFTVYTSDLPGMTLATAYTDATGTTPLPSAQFTSNAQGNLIAYLTDGALYYGQVAGQSFRFPMAVGAQGDIASSIAAQHTADIAAFASIDPSNRYQLFTASGTFTVPANVTRIRARALGGGGGGGSGGSALTTSGVTSQAPGGGGGAGMFQDLEVAVTPGQAITVTVGAGGAGGAGGAVNGGAGGYSNSGGSSTFLTIVGAGGGGGGPSGGNTANAGDLGSWGGGALQSSGGGGGGLPGFGGKLYTTGCNPAPPGVVGGGYGAAATGSLGGVGGGACTALPVVGIGGSTATTTTTSGGNGTTALIAGCGGGAGGGGAPGGTGGNGGAGAPGMVEVSW